MVRFCKDICYRIANQHIFSQQPLPYDEGSFCSTCNIWIKKPTNSKLGITIECMPNPWDVNHHYYDIEGKRRNVKLLVPIPKLVKKVVCKCCGTQCRGKTHHTNNYKLRNKIFATFKEILDRPPRARIKKERSSKQQDIDSDINEESVFDLTGTELAI